MVEQLASPKSDDARKIFFAFCKSCFWTATSFRAAELHGPFWCQQCTEQEIIFLPLEQNKSSNNTRAEILSNVQDSLRLETRPRFRKNHYSRLVQGGAAS
jgi:hypothetical protein